MRITNEEARQAIGALGAWHDPNAEKTIEEVTSRDWRWYHILWLTVTCPREFWMGLRLGLKR